MTRTPVSVTVVFARSVETGAQSSVDLSRRRSSSSSPHHPCIVTFFATPLDECVKESSIRGRTSDVDAA
jgi:hypothetical protein